MQPTLVHHRTHAGRVRPAAPQPSHGDRRVKPALPLRSAKCSGRRPRRPWKVKHSPACATRSIDSLIARSLFACLAWMTTAPGCDTGSPSDSPSATGPAASPVTRTAEDGPVKLTVHTDRDAVGPDDRLMLTLTIEAERGVEIQAPVFENVLGSFVIVDEAKPEPTAGDMTARLEHTYTLEGVLPGEHDIPAITVEYTDDRPRADGSRETTTGSVATAPIPIRVDLGLADVKGPATLPMSLPRKIILWAVGLVAAMVAVALAARWWRKRRAIKEEQAPLARRLVAHQWALAELDRLMAENLIAAGRVQEFYYRLNGLIRRYIELRFGLMASEQTSEEFIRALHRSPALDEPHKDLLREFTEACDPVKYAAIVPQRDDVDWVAESARRFVRETAWTGAPEPPAEAEPAEAEAAA